MNNLRYYRHVKNMTREALSRATGIKTGTIKHWEDGTVELENASYINVIKVANALEVEPDKLFLSPFLQRL